MSETNRKRDAEKQERSWLMEVFQMFAIAGGCLLGYHLFLAPTTTEAETENKAYEGPGRGIVVVDSKAILGNFMERMEKRIARGEEMTEGQLNMSGQDFAAEYMRAIKKYRDKGYLVIDKQYALGVPRESEITVEIGEALGMVVEVTTDPFSAPSIQ